MIRQRDVFERWLQAHGWTRDNGARSTHYLVYVKPSVSKRVYLGPNGAFRYGRNIANSTPLPQFKREQIIAEYRDNA